jgi:hypothetical protein
VHVTAPDDDVDVVVGDDAGKSLRDPTQLDRGVGRRLDGR